MKENDQKVQEAIKRAELEAKVGRCRLTLSNPS